MSEGSLDLHREMGFSHVEFRRALQRTYGGQVEMHPYGATVHTDHGGRVAITLGEESTRRIALLAIPVTAISFAFHDFTLAQRDAFMQHFDLYFRRGGG